MLPPAGYAPRVNRHPEPLSRMRSRAGSLVAGGVIHGHEGGTHVPRNGPFIRHASLPICPGPGRRAPAIDTGVVHTEVLILGRGGLESIENGKGGPGPHLPVRVRVCARMAERHIGHDRCNMCGHMVNAPLPCTLVYDAPVGGFGAVRGRHDGPPAPPNRRKLTTTTIQVCPRL